MIPKILKAIPVLSFVLAGFISTQVHAGSGPNGDDPDSNYSGKNDLNVNLVGPLHAAPLGAVPEMTIDTEDELNAAHQKYAEFTHRDVADVVKAWNQNMGGVYPATMEKNIQAFKNFYSFIKEVDGQPLISPLFIHAVAVEDKNIKAHAFFDKYTQSRGSGATVDMLQDFLSDLKNLLKETQGLNERINAAVSIYHLPARAVLQDNPKWKAGSLQSTLFSESTEECIYDYAYYGDAQGPSAYQESLFNETLSEILNTLDRISRANTYSYKKADHTTGYVSFVDFGYWYSHIFKKGQGGLIGGLGAFNTDSVEFLGNYFEVAALWVGVIVSGCGRIR